MNLPRKPKHEKHHIDHIKHTKWVHKRSKCTDDHAISKCVDYHAKLHQSTMILPVDVNCPACGLRQEKVGEYYLHSNKTGNRPPEEGNEYLCHAIGTYVSNEAFHLIQQSPFEYD